MQSIGTVTELWRYPVKSMLGERCETLRIDARGVEGDRVFAIQDASGKLGSGKNTRRFRKIDGLFRFHASYQDAVPQLRFPGGEVMSADNPTIDRALSDALGQSVALVRESNASHLDAAPIHLLTSASLEWLRVELPGVHLDARRFRPNLVIALPGRAQVEQAWIGRRLRVGEHVTMLVRAPTERCGMVAFAQSELPEEPQVLRTITQQAGLRFGVYAEVAVPGLVRLNDRVALEA